MFHSFYSSAPLGGDIRFHFAFTREDAMAVRERVAAQGRRVTDCREAIATLPSAQQMQAGMRTSWA